VRESEADHLGLVYMAKAGHDPREARGDLWVRMAPAFQDSARPLELLSTDPSGETRVQQIDAWLPEAFRHYTPAR
jgi:predicted Zn-dependent protease